MVLPLTFRGDCLIDDFKAEDVQKASNYLDFLYEKQILSSDEYMRKLELQSGAGARESARRFQPAAGGGDEC